MKVSTNSCHHEYGNAIALNGRDCSIQRRHQKIIKEGPPVAPSPFVWKWLEDTAVSLAKAVGYSNTGTVEYLQSEQDEKFYFLKLNLRLPVEHPVTEMITWVNLPAAQLQVAMGISLHHILAGRWPWASPFTTSRRSAHSTGGTASRNAAAVVAGESKTDFTTATRVPPAGHCIVVPIKAENADAGF